MKIKLTQNHIEASRRRLIHGKNSENSSIVFNGEKARVDEAWYKTDAQAVQIANLADREKWDEIKPCVFNLNYP